MRKSNFKISSLPPGICITEKKNPYHIYWLCFHFPLRESIVMRKEIKVDCFLPSALSTQLILLGGQISAVPGEEKTENESDQSETKWSVTRVCCNEEPWLWTTLHSLLFISKWRQAHRGWFPSTEPGPSWTSVLDCAEKWSMLASPLRHI